MTDLAEYEIDPRLISQVWQGLGLKPLKQIADETGLSRDQIIRLREEMLSSVDDLTIQQKRQKLIMSLEEMAQEARAAFDNADYEFKAGLINASVGAIAKVLAELNRMEKADTSKVDSLNAMRVRELVALVREAVDTSVPQIAAQYGIDEEDLFDVFNENLQLAAQRRDSL